MALVIAHPVHFSVDLSFYDTLPSPAVGDEIRGGLENYGRSPANESLHEVTVNTLLRALWSALSAFLPGLGAALVRDRRSRGRGPLRGVLRVPLMIAAVAASCTLRRT